MKMALQDGPKDTTGHVDGEGVTPVVEASQAHPGGSLVSSDSSTRAEPHEADGGHEPPSSSSSDDEEQVQEACPKWAQNLILQLATQAGKAERRQSEALDQMVKVFSDSQEAAQRRKIPKAPTYSVQKLKLEATVGEVEDWIAGIIEVNATMAPGQPDRYYVVWAVAQMQAHLQNSWRGHRKAKGLDNPTFEDLASFLRKEHSNPGQRIKDTIDALENLSPREDEDPLTHFTSYQNYVSLLGPKYAPMGRYEVFRFLGKFPGWLQREFTKQEKWKVDTVEEVAYALHRLWKSSYRTLKGKKTEENDRKARTRKREYAEPTKKAWKKTHDQSEGVQCFGCGKMGHYKSNCPTKRVEKRRTQDDGRGTRVEAKRPKVQQTSRLKPAEIFSSSEDSGNE
ncbi:uncharacterized protein BROUX77_005573 [Berkeleyomyces rouxiae]|uniref:uncharacterized protein n=1 Tax=Berkeleyomyces rouxiae TaxID=2035830 RepID=UPI003B7AD5A2